MILKDISTFQLAIFRAWAGVRPLQLTEVQQVLPKNSDLSEELTDLFVASAAMYFKLALWNERQSGKDDPHKKLQDILHATALDLMRLSDDGPSEQSQQLELVARGLQDLLNGIGDIDGTTSARRAQARKLLIARSQELAAQLSSVSQQQ